MRITMNRLILFFALMATNTLAMAQTSDSLIVNELRKDGVRFSSNNTVVLLKSGQEKFDDMFEAIRTPKVLFIWNILTSGMIPSQDVSSRYLKKKPRKA